MGHVGGSTFAFCQERICQTRFSCSSSTLVYWTLSTEFKNVFLYSFAITYYDLWMYRGLLCDVHLFRCRQTKFPHSRWQRSSPSTSTHTQTHHLPWNSANRIWRISLTRHVKTFHNFWFSNPLETECCSLLIHSLRKQFPLTGRASYISRAELGLMTLRCIYASSLWHILAKSTYFGITSSCFFGKPLNAHRAHTSSGSLYEIRE